MLLRSKKRVGECNNVAANTSNQKSRVVERIVIGNVEMEVEVEEEIEVEKELKVEEVKVEVKEEEEKEKEEDDRTEHLLVQPIKKDINFDQLLQSLDDLSAEPGTTKLLKTLTERGPEKPRFLTVRDFEDSSLECEVGNQTIA
ncbi:unnamed protein product [Rotaria sordida]|uniref:Uncharacterized protein n=1 Tax=Rotaria sordida TaxID=392033 RepID=A0A815ITC3_9BILA|nr:unnamed protein product [Rotaria sordida]